MLNASDIAAVYVGTIVTPQLDRSLSILEDQLLVVDNEGFIRHLEARDTPASNDILQLFETNQLDKDRFFNLGKDGWLLPGFIDTHIHAPQYVNAGMALDRPLMEWLEKYTFHAESRIDRDPSGYGQQVYQRLVKRLVENGTTSASVFGTISVEANLVLAQTFLDAGLRGQIGKVAMDQNSIPTYIETTETSLSETSRFIRQVRQLVQNLPETLHLVEPVVTPRFVPTCSIPLLKGLVKIARDEGVRIQSHLAESQGEVDLCKKLLDGQTDVELFEEIGLLTSTSLMAHCTHAFPSDLSLLSRTGTSIAHCPLSNVYFSSERQLPLREAWTAGVKVGLGSDISGGYRVGIDENMRWSVGVSKLRQGERVRQGRDHESETVAITWKESIYLATLGGAQALGLDDTRRVGKLEVGSAFDAQWIELGRKGSRVDWFENESGGDLSIEEKLEKWWCNGSEVDRRGVWVQGRRVYDGDLE